MAPGPILPTPTQALSTQWVEDRPMWAAQPQLQMHPLFHLSQEVARLVSKYNWFQFWALKKYCHCHLSIREGSKKNSFICDKFPNMGGNPKVLVKLTNHCFLWHIWPLYIRLKFHFLLKSFGKFTFWVPNLCRPPQCRLDALWGLRDADRMEIRKYHLRTYGR